jgi:hypothetical protein
MSDRKTIEIPDDWEPGHDEPEPFVAFAGPGDDGRDPSKPIAYDEQGRPLYAPRGVVHRWPGWPG